MPSTKKSKSHKRVIATTRRDPLLLPLDDPRARRLIPGVDGKLRVLRGGPALMRRMAKWLGLPVPKRYRAKGRTR